MDVPALVDALTRQIRLHESRAGRRAVSVCVAVPVGVDVGAIRAALHRALGPDESEIVLALVLGEPRVLTLDFEAEAEPEPEPGVDPAARTMP